MGAWVSTAYLQPLRLAGPNGLTHPGLIVPGKHSCGCAWVPVDTLHFLATGIGPNLAGMAVQGRTPTVCSQAHTSRVHALLLVSGDTLAASQMKSTLIKS